MPGRSDRRWQQQGGEAEAADLLDAYLTAQLDRARETARAAV